MPKRKGGDAGIRAATDPAIVTAALAELDSVTSTALATERTNIEATLQSVWTAAGDNIDLSLPAVAAIEGFAGTVGERATKVIQIHSRLAAVNELEHRNHRVSEIRSEIQSIRENSGPNPDDPVRSQLRRTPLYDRVVAHLTETYGHANILAALDQAGGDKMALVVNDFDTARYLGAVVTTDAGFDPFVIRQPGATPMISRPLQVYQTLPMSMTDQHSIDYMVQTTRTATPIVEKAEGAESGEAVMEWTERSEKMREIPGHIPVTEIQMEDEPQIRAIIDMDLRLMVMQRLDGQLINGDAADGTADVNVAGLRAYRGGTGAAHKPVPYIWGHSGSIGSSSARNDQIDDAKKAKTKLVLTGRVMPDRYYFHHTIWDEISLSETTAAGYYLGSPAMSFEERLWGLPVTLSDHFSDSSSVASSNGGLLVDSMWMRIWCRRALHSEIGWNEKDFIKRQLTIRAAIRCCLQIRRPQAVLEFNMAAS